MRYAIVAAGVLGAVALLYPAVVLGFTEAQPYETQIMRWLGLVLLGATVMWPWAQRHGNDPARRLRRWLRAAAVFGLLLVLTTNPMFMVLAFTVVTAAVLDAMLERATITSFELMAQLKGEDA